MTLISRLVFFKDKKTSRKSSERIETNQISIVIPVKDNQQGIERYLERFFETHKPENYPKEIIVIDNNSRPALYLDDKYLKYGVPIQLIECLTKGPAAARNKGAFSSNGKWLLFNDSDCIPTETLLTGYQSADNFSVAYAGNIKSHKKDRLSRYYESQEILIPLKTYDQDGKFVPQYLITANALVWKDAFLEINGFNEKINIAGGEDVDLGLRLSRIGKLSYAFDSIAVHDFSDGILGFYSRFIRYGQGNRFVEQIWKTDLKPRLFRPNERTLINEFYAKFQYFFLRIGYRQASKKIKNGW